MNKFKYECCDYSGGRRRGVVFAESADQAVAQLAGTGVVVTNIELAGTRRSAWTLFNSRSAERELALFCRQLAVLLEAGMPLDDALAVFDGKSGAESFNAVVRDIRASLRRGRSLSRSLADWPEVFSETFVQLVAAGELTGTLDAVLERLADNLEKLYRLRDKVRMILIYPLFVVAATTIMLTIMLTVVVPRFVMLFEYMNIPLPFMTRLLLAVSEFVTGYAPMLALALVAAGCGLWRWYRGGGRLWIDTLLLKLPVVGSLIAKAGQVQLMWALSLLLNSSIPVVEALAVSARSVNNRRLRFIVGQVQQDVVKGQNIADSFARHGALDATFIQAVAVGEAGGRLDIVLGRLAAVCDNEVHQSIERLNRLLEPALMLVIGGVVGVVVIAIMQPVLTATADMIL